MSIQITKNLLSILSKEASRRDRDFYAGNFAETALIEHLFRYWLESALGADGFDEINREVSYKKAREDEQRKACDLVAYKNNRKHWVVKKPGQIYFLNTTEPGQTRMARAEPISRAVFCNADIARRNTSACKTRRLPTTGKAKAARSRSPSRTSTR